MAMFTALEPMSTGDVIDRAVRLYRRNFSALISIVAVPAVFGYIVKLMFSYGYSSLVMGAANKAPNFSGDAVAMMIAGAVGYPIWLFILLMTVSGLSRVVGDNVMLNEPIKFRRCLSAIRKRLGAITLMGLLCVAMLFLVYIVFSIFVFVVALMIGAVAGVVAAAKLPSWLVGTLLGIAILIAAACLIALLLAIVARIVFMPQIVMIEGQGAGSALGRAITLGRGNGYKIGGIALFTYFIQLSLLSALTLPVLASLYLSNAIGPDFFFSQTWTVLYTSFGDLSGLLSFPIWIVSFTLLYFDSRVRKEAYDVELLAREVAPGFYWQPTVQTSAFGYPAVLTPGQTRAYVQTSPLGLAGWRPEVSPPASASVNQSGGGRSIPSDSVVSFPSEPLPAPPPGEFSTARGWCRNCAAELRPNDVFCMQCGTSREQEVVAG
jgi:hypothetical protein